MAFWHSLVDPRVASHLIADEGEIVIDEVRRHWTAFVLPILITLLGLLIMLAALWSPLVLAWLPVAGGLVITLIGAYRALSAHMDRFVITNMRVFRVHGIVAQHTATMPMSRILDISVHKPLVGRIFGYGHFVFESAAQDQGLRDIRYVGRPDQRDLTIQRVIQRSGLRSAVRSPDEVGGKPVRSSGPSPSNVETAPTPSSPSSPQQWLVEHDPTDGGPAAAPIGDDENLGSAESDAEWLSATWSDRDQADHERARQQ